MGRLDDFQRNKVRVWATYGLGLGRAGRLDLAPMYRYNSAKTFSYTATVPMSAAQLANNPGLRAGADVADALLRRSRRRLVRRLRAWSTSRRRSDPGVADAGALGEGRSAEPAEQPEARQLGHDRHGRPQGTARRERAAARTTSQGANFGNATSTTNYPRPRAGMDGGRTFLMSFGLRFRAGRSVRCRARGGSRREQPRFVLGAKKDCHVKAPPPHRAGRRAAEPGA